MNIPLNEFLADTTISICQLCRGATHSSASQREALCVQTLLTHEYASTLIEQLSEPMRMRQISRYSTIQSRAKCGKGCFFFR